MWLSLSLEKNGTGIQTFIFDLLMATDVVSLCRFTMEFGTPFEDFLRICCEKAGMPLKLKYTDSQGDQISVENTRGLKEALTFFEDTGILRLEGFLATHGEKKVTEYPLDESSSSASSDDDDEQDSVDGIPSDEEIDVASIDLVVNDDDDMCGSWVMYEDSGSSSEHDLQSDPEHDHDKEDEGTDKNMAPHLPPSGPKDGDVCNTDTIPSRLESDEKEEQAAEDDSSISHGHGFDGERAVDNSSACSSFMHLARDEAASTSSNESPEETITLTKSQLNGRLQSRFNTSFLLCRKQSP